MRGDVYAHAWENKKSGKKGYSPVCNNEWRDGVCFKPKVKCADCSHQSFLPFDEKAAIAHLTGKTLIGSYAINSDDMCSFLAADFDKGNWKEDALCYKQVGNELGVDIAIEISKSGNGAHCWIFFNELVSARDARVFGLIILTRAQEKSSTYKLESYDRFFPNQDFIPKGGRADLVILLRYPYKRDIEITTHQFLLTHHLIHCYINGNTSLTSIFSLKRT